MNKSYANRIKYDHLFLLWNDWVHRCNLCFILFMIPCVISLGCEDQDTQSQTEQAGIEEMQIGGEQIGTLPVAGMLIDPTQSGREQAGVQAGEMSNPQGGEGGGQQGGEQGGIMDQSCIWAHDCPQGDCIDGECSYETLTSCLGDQECADDELCETNYCLRMCEIEQSCAIRVSSCVNNYACPYGMVCHQERCINACETDLNCPSHAYCLDGVCTAFDPNLLNNAQPTLQGSLEQIYVGIGQSLLDYSVGVSLAGYGGRSGPRTPYNQSLGGSHSIWDRQDVRAVVIDNGEDLSILIRLPLAWSTDYLRTLIAIELQKLTQNDTVAGGVNYLDHLLIFATHSHSQPARFWNLVPNLPFGGLGFGTFSVEMTHRYARSAAQAAYLALQDLSPARIGWEVIQDTDPQRKIHSNRRKDLQDNFDDRLLMIRIDDLEGTPRTALVGFGIHGTHLQRPLISGDAAQGIEVVFTQELSARYQREVPAIFLNGNAGNISPRGDHLTKEVYGHIQTIGLLLWKNYAPVFESLITQANPSFKWITKRVPVDYDLLGYGKEDVDFRAQGEAPYRFGAFTCVALTKELDGEPYTKEAPSCGINIQDIVRSPVPQFQKTVLSILQLDELILTTLPGEPTSGLGLQLAQQLEADAREAGWNDPISFNIGYAQDHHFYLLTSDDWFYGGYEASMGLWGWREGEYLIQQSRLIAQELWGGEAYPEYSLWPTWWPNLTDDTREASSSTQIDWNVEPQDEYQKGQLVQVQWHGGDPAIDLPKVQLLRATTERDTQGNLIFEPALAPRTSHILDDRGFESIIKYLGDYETQHTWGVTWDLPILLPEGSYRIVVQGRYSTTSSQIQDYDLVGKVFQLNGNHAILAHQVELESDQFNIDFTYVHSPSNNDGISPFNALKAQGSILHVRDLLPDLITGTLGPKAYRFILGPPLSDSLSLQIRHNNMLYVSSINSTSVTCTVALVTARTEDLQEQVETIQAPCSRVSFNLQDLSEALGFELRNDLYQITIIDEAKNRWQYDYFRGR